LHTSPFLWSSDHLREERITTPIYQPFTSNISGSTTIASVEDFVAGKSWIRGIRRRQVAHGNNLPDEWVTSKAIFTVVEGFDKKSPDKEIIVSYDDSFLKDRGSFRLIFDRHGVLRAYQYGGPQKWTTAKLTQEKYGLTDLESAIFNLALLRLPVDKENAIKELKSASGRDVSAIVAVKGNEVTVTCALKLRPKEMEGKSPTQNVAEVLTITYRKGEPIPIKVESNLEPEPRLFEVAPAK
ncbi:MAG TPA: hypothetical protein VEJ63_24440, partial [Planctomycetota bacterium]|nr:hypothetical protein [Planctomycetota bacterium]